jgi:P pilus assembly chaperone PapD
MSKHNHKTLSFMTEQFKNLKATAPSMFYSALNELSMLANGEDPDEIRSQMYTASFHTDQFFVDLLKALGYDEDGCPLDI